MRTDHPGAESCHFNLEPMTKIVILCTIMAILIPLLAELKNPLRLFSVVLLKIVPKWTTSDFETEHFHILD